LHYIKENKAELEASDFLINEQPAINGAYSFLSSYLKRHKYVQNEVETFKKSLVNADGTVGKKIHAYVMDAYKKVD
jgi:hypothetical protein